MFHTGDVVKYVGKKCSWKKPHLQHIIHEASYLGRGKFKYTTNRGAWFSETDFELVRKANKQSFEQLDKDIRDEEDH